MYLYLDIETIQCEDEALKAKLAAGIRPPGNLKKPETIAKWEAEDKPSLVEEAVRKTSFDGTYGRVLAIGYATDGEPSCFIGDEAETINAFFVGLRDVTRLPIHGGETEHAVTFVGHNVSGFDLRFLWQRAVIHSIKPPRVFMEAVRAKPWSPNVVDTMVMWHPDRDKRISLGNLCKALCVESPKGDLDGSKIAEFYAAGRIDEIATYCKGDVTAVRECHKRMAFL